MTLPIKVKIEVPIYDVDLWVIVDEEAEKRRSEMAQEFGPPPEKSWGALCSYNYETGTVALFFYPELMTRNIIAHEVYHATSHILCRAGVRYDPANHEAFAHLCGWLTQEVYRVREKPLTSRP